MKQCCKDVVSAAATERTALREEGLAVFGRFKVGLRGEMEILENRFWVRDLEMEGE